MGDSLRLPAVIMGGLAGVMLAGGGQASSTDGNVEWYGVYSDTTENFVTPAEFNDGDTITLAIRVNANDLTAAYCRLYFSGNGQEEYLTMTRSETGTIFDRWSVSVQVPSGTTQVWYRFALEDGDDLDWYDAGDKSDDWKYRGMNDEGRQSRDFMLVPGFSTPDWSKQSVFYQIFPDRFNDGDASNNRLYPDDCFWYLDYAPACSDSSCPGYNAQCAQYEVPEASPGYTKNCEVNEDWSDLPNGGPCDFFGGDLNGVEDKLDYLHELNVNGLYLNPVFRSPSNHKYDTQSYDDVDPRFGGISALSGLTVSAAALSMRVVLDGVFNHESDLGEHYNLWGNYSFDSSSQAVDGFDFYPTSCGVWEEGFLNPMASNWMDCNSSWSDRFKIWIGTDTYDVDRDGDTSEPAAHTCGWYGFEFMPDIDYKSPSEANSEARVWLYGGTSAGNELAARDSVAGMWLEDDARMATGVDGWRLDVPDNAGYFTSSSDSDCSKADNDSSIWKGFRTATKTIGSNKLIVGEIWDDASDGQPNWSSNFTFDGVMNYHFFNMPISCFITGTGVHSDTGECAGDYGPLTNGAATSVTSLDAHWAEGRRVYPTAFLQSSWNQLSSHDTTRFMSRASGSYDKVKEAFVMQATAPGAPVIYYGDEVGVEGDSNETGRATFPWSALDDSSSAESELHDFVQSMMCIRRSYPALQTGSFVTLWAEGGNPTYGYGRFDDQDQIAVAINNGDATRNVTLEVWRLDIQDGTVMIDVMTDHAYTVSGGALAVSVSARSGMILVPENRSNLGQQCAGGTEPVNLPPVATVSGDVTMCEDESATLDGSDSYDPEGESLTYSWTLDGKEVGTQSSINVSGLAEGTYIYTLTVSDGVYESSADAVVSVEVCCTGCECEQPSPTRRFGLLIPVSIGGLLIGALRLRRRIRA